MARSICEAAGRSCLHLAVARGEINLLYYTLIASGRDKLYTIIFRSIVQVRNGGIIKGHHFFSCDAVYTIKLRIRFVWFT